MPSKMHEIFSKDPYDHDKEILNYINSKNFKKDEYINLLSGKYQDEEGNIAHPRSFPMDIMEAVENSKHNNHKNNHQVVQNLHNSSEDELPTRKLQNFLSDLAEDYNLHEDTIHDIIDHMGTDREKGQNSFPRTDLNELSSQDSFNKDHMLKLIEKDKDHEYLYRGSKADEISKDKDVLDAIENKQNKHSDHYKVLAENGRLNKDLIKKNIRDYEPGKHNYIFDTLRNLDEDQKEELINYGLGIKGGYYKDDELEDEENYDNWHHGAGYNEKFAKDLIGNSKFEVKQDTGGLLSADHIDHIIRHGDFEPKYKIYQNENIDPDKRMNMLKKWHDDDHHHGYDRDELRDHLYNRNMEDHHEEVRDEARELAENDISFSDFIRNNYDSDELERMMFDNDGGREGWVDEYLKENYDWTGPDPEGEDEEYDYEDDMEHHPEYEKRKQEAHDEFEKEFEERVNNPGHHLPDEIIDQYDEYIRENTDEHADDLLSKEKEHNYTKYDVPDDIEKHPEYENILSDVRQRKSEHAHNEAKHEERMHSDLLNNHIPQREREHWYGKGQHQLEMLKDYADARGGKIDAGTMHKLQPQNKEIWKKTFKDKGKLSSDEIQQKIDELPKKKYNISFSKWSGNSPQNVNNQDQMIVRLDHSQESMEPFTKDAKTHNLFRKIQESSQHSGHPTNFNTIAWSRVDANNPKHWMVDELQSDFDSTTRKYIKNKGDDEHKDAFKQIEKGHGEWREALLNYLYKEGKKHGVEGLHTHSPESKTSQTGGRTIHSVYKDSYQKVPRKMGFQPNEFGNLPLTDSGQKHFTKDIKGGMDTDDKISAHEEGVEEHALMAMAHKNIIDKESHNMDDDQLNLHKEHAEKHTENFNNHRKKLFEMDPTRTQLSKYDTPDKYYENVYAKGLDRQQLESKRQGMHNNAHENVKSRLEEEYAFPRFGFDRALEEKTTGESAHKGHTLDLRPEAFQQDAKKAEELAKSEKQRSEIAQLLYSVKENQEVIDKLKDENPELYSAITEMIQSLVKIFKQKTGYSENDIMHEHEIKGHLDQYFGEEEDEEDMEKRIRAKKAPRIHRRKLVFEPGTTRQYTSQSARQKTPEGDWVSVKGNVKKYPWQ